MLGRDDIGALAPGMAADFVAFDLRGYRLRGRAARPGGGARVLRAGAVAFSVINGRVVVAEGRLTTVDLPVLVERHNVLAARLVHGDA